MVPNISLVHNRSSIKLVEFWRILYRGGTWILFWCCAYLSNWKLCSNSHLFFFSPAHWRRLQGKVQSSARTGRTDSQVELAHCRLFHASTGELSEWSKLSRWPWPLGISIHPHSQECILSSVEECLPIVTTFLEPRYSPSNKNLLLIGVFCVFF